ncbi:AbrB/MazE/SpoVT family DNA-binding domain-containing protein [Methanobrevibacter sp. TMH8]|uniref:AbrB/MazE/SpoVT family DNA-binding domain-containing protein n=1 Tax=Methanobrevibacter sp. TMH8 TaxID=2848611 RepID=UPI001CCCDABC|nr:AbrB/MazE/SpoVT family DNA-binding domain-containing protein [Methanobrevibacter sp. TMH8]MBZ9570867.1 AbrB/MazE/SpoVT family DNA-binding domain-containing protein [Methanobrevibacter sp. TMH8]
MKVIKTFSVNVNKANKNSSTLKITIPSEIRDFLNIKEKDVVDYSVIEIDGEYITTIKKSENLEDLKKLNQSKKDNLETKSNTINYEKDQDNKAIENNKNETPEYVNKNQKVEEESSNENIKTDDIKEIKEFTKQEKNKLNWLWKRERNRDITNKELDQLLTHYQKYDSFKLFLKSFEW